MSTYSTTEPGPSGSNSDLRSLVGTYPDGGGYRSTMTRED